MYSGCGNLVLARQAFDEIAQPDLPSRNSTIHASVRGGLVDIARKLFDKMPERNVISWSCMINGYVRFGEHKEALAMFRQMQEVEGDKVTPNQFPMSCVLSACGRFGALEHGKWVHTDIGNCGVEVDVVLGTSLIDMYAKCGSIGRAKWVFDNMGPRKDVMAWSVMDMPKNALNYLQR